MNLASIFTDNMVLQRRQPVRVFGEGEGRVSVEFKGQTKTAEATEGKWCVEFPPQEAGGPYEMTVDLPDERIILRDILIGEVWIAAGQSNMEMPVFWDEHGLADAAAYQNHEIRLFCVPRRMKHDRTHLDWNFGIMKEEDTPWQVCNEESALKFSAIGYYTARELYKALGVPIGIVSVNWGGRCIEPFISRKYCGECESLKKEKEEFDAIVAKTDPAAYERELDEVIAGKNHYFTYEVGDVLDLVRRIGTRASREHIRYQDAPNISTGIYDTNSVGTLWDSMFSRIVPYSVKGTMWYQGESNGEQRDYLEKYRTLLHCLRTEFRQPDMPIYAVELASYWDWSTISLEDLREGRFVTESNWAFLREQQQQATELPNSYLVTMQEIGDPFDIHPAHKRELGHRMSNKILQHSYGCDIMADNPTYNHAEFGDGKAVLYFDHVDELFAPEINTVHMMIAGADHILKKANLTVKGNTITVQSDQVPEPVLVRYGFDYAYFGSHIYNEAGLPLSPFRTDSDE